MNRAQQMARAKVAKAKEKPRSLPVGSDLHLLEMLLSDIDKMRDALQPFATAAKQYDARMFPLDSGHQTISLPLAYHRRAREVLGQ